MKPATVAARQTIERDHAVRVKARVVAEWEYNRFYTPTVTVTPAQANDDERWTVYYGDLNTIALPTRPRTGIAFARSDASIKPLSDYRDSPQAARFYPSGSDATYSYWSSTQRSSLVNTGGDYNFDTPIQVTVTYPQAVAANKIVVGFETSYAKPVQYTIEGTSNGTDWFTVQSNPILEANGTTTLYFGSDGWNTYTTPDLINPVVIKGLRVNVYSMDKPFSHVDILQLGARLENDLTDFLVDYNVKMEVSSRSFIAPLGQASSNEASITLSNIDGRFNNHNPNSLYFGLIEKKVKFRIDIGIDASQHGGSAYEYVREFTGWAETWGGEGQTQVTVELKDSSVFLQEQKMPVVFFENATSGAVVWQVMDRLGMTNYAYTRAIEDFGQVIPFYWPEKDSTVWEEFSKIAEATQTAIYYDENDILQIKARKAMFNPSEPVDWNFDAIANGQKLPDIAKLEVNYELETNQVEVQYQPANYSDFNKGLPKLETVWEPDEETIVLRASALTKDLSSVGTDLWISQGDASSWPFESDVNIRGEILHYKGKEYGYYNAAGALAKKVIFTLDEQKTLDALNENLSWKNAYTGRFIVTARKLYGSDVASHKVNGDRYYSIVTNFASTVNYPWEAGGVQYLDGFIRQTCASNQEHEIHIRRHESSVPPLPGGTQTVWYGTRFRFPFAEAKLGSTEDQVKTDAATQTAKWRKGGIWFGGATFNGGYYLEITSTSQEDGWEGRRWSNEFALQGKNDNGSHYNIGGKGFKFPIFDNAWNDVDMSYSKTPDGNVTITVFCNSVLVGSWIVPPAQQPTGNTWRFGTFTRGPAVMDFEYLYAFSRNEQDGARRTPDDTGWLDLKAGGYSSGFIAKEVKYNFRDISPYIFFVNKRLSMEFPQRINNSTFIFDEFSPIVHELRMFDVKFKDESCPVSHSWLYLSNVGSVEILHYEPNAFGANFMLANASRENAILQGEDKVTFTADNSVNREMFIYGRSVYQEEDKTVIKNDDASIRRRGITRTEVSSRYIQTDEMANELGQWIVDLWATGVDEITLETFGNPLIQLGDLVTINYPIKDMYPATHKYFVVSINNEFSEGYKTTVILRRARS